MVRRRTISSRRWKSAAKTEKDFRSTLWRSRTRMSAHPAASSPTSTAPPIQSDSGKGAMKKIAASMRP
jgi:hypothetical protein